MNVIPKTKGAKYSTEEVADFFFLPSRFRQKKQQPMTSVDDDDNKRTKKKSRLETQYVSSGGFSKCVYVGKVPIGGDIITVPYAV